MNRNAVWLVGLGVLAVLPACVCSSPGQHADPTLSDAQAPEAGVPETAPSDASPDDGASEAAPEASPDAATSFAQACSTIPAATDPIPAGFPQDAWRLPALPPEVLVFGVPPPTESLTWNSCGDGCKELATSWANPATGPLSGVTGGVVNGIPWLALGERISGNMIRGVVGPADGSAVYSLMENDPFHVNPDTGFFSAVELSPSGISFCVYNPDLYFVFHQTLGEAPKCLATAKSADTWLSAVLLSDRWAVAGSPAPVLTGAWPPVAGHEDLLTLSAPTGDQLNDVTTAGQRLVWFGYGAGKQYHLWTWQPGEPVQLLVNPPPSSGQQNCCAASTDDQIAWLRGTGYNEDSGYAAFDQVDLMTAPLPINLLPVTGSRVRTVPQPSMSNPGVVGGGYWANAAWPADDPSAGYIYVVRLSDGRMWKIPERGPQQPWTKILYVTSSEIAILEGYWGHPGWASTVVRYDLASLGPGEAP